MVKVSGAVVKAARVMTVDAEVSKIHCYTALTAAGKKVLSHNSVSLLAGSTPGVHWPIAKYYVRRVRYMKNSPLLEAIVAAGYKVEPCYGSESTTVVIEFPIALDEDIRTDKEVSMWEKLHLTEFVQKWWADNQVSVTVTFDPKTEARMIEPALNYFQYGLKSVSFLPQSAGVYKQMPYEAITKEQYEEMIAGITTLTFDEKLVSLDAVDEREMFCDGDTCTFAGPAVKRKRDGSNSNSPVSKTPKL